MRTTTANSAENDDDEFLYDDGDDDDVQDGGANYFDANNAPLLSPSYPQRSTDFRKWWRHRHHSNASASAATKGDSRVLLLGGVESPSDGHFFIFVK